MPPEYFQYVCLPSRKIRVFLKAAMTRIPFHVIGYRPWPALCAGSSLCMTLGLVTWFHTTNPYPLLLALLALVLSIAQWWRDIIREATFQGLHTSVVAKGLRWGIIFFIASEVMFFIRIFWAFFHRRLAPTPEIGCRWPPPGITPLDPFAVPLLNTAVLLASGVTVTWAHHSLIEGDRKNAIAALGITVCLGAYFSVLQAHEYQEAPFTIADRIYGTTFFVATGFHGLHVLIGSIFLGVCFLRLVAYQFSPGHHIGFETAAWYWHFVDVVWLFLYISIYWWGS